MYLEKLKQILPPPNRVADVVKKISWEDIEDNIKLTFPDDYKEFIRCYGIGQICDFINIDVPVNFNLYLEETKNLCNNYLSIKSMFPNKYNYRVYPKPNSLYPLGTTDNGDELWWLTDPNPIKWRIVVYGSRSWDHYEYSMSLSEFLYKILIKTIRCDAFPASFPDEIVFSNVILDIQK
jgi:hypothetical protein